VDRDRGSETISEPSVEQQGEYSAVQQKLKKSYLRDGDNKIREYDGNRLEVEERKGTIVLALVRWSDDAMKGSGDRRCSQVAIGETLSPSLAWVNLCLFSAGFKIWYRGRGRKWGGRAVSARGRSHGDSQKGVSRRQEWKHKGR
jgi:hypothetical protein